MRSAFYNCQTLMTLEVPRHILVESSYKSSRKSLQLEPTCSLPIDRHHEAQSPFFHIINAPRNGQLCFKISLRIVVLFFFSFLFVRIRTKVFRFLNSFSLKPKLKQAILGPFSYNPYASLFIHLPSMLLSLNTERISNINHGLSNCGPSTTTCTPTTAYW